MRVIFHPLPPLSTNLTLVITACASRAVEALLLTVQCRWCRGHQKSGHFCQLRVFWVAASTTAGGQCQTRGQPGTCGHLCHVWRSHGLCCYGQRSRGLTNGRLCDWRESLAGPLPGLPTYSWPRPLVAARRLKSRAPPRLCSQVLWGYKLSGCSWGIQN